MPGKTLYISDLDGTLLDDTARLPPEAAHIINAKIGEGLLFTYATARSFTTSSVVTEGLALSAPVIVNNGVYIKGPKTGKALHSCLLDSESAKPVTSAIEAAGIPAIAFSVVGGTERFSWLEGNENPGLKSYLTSRKGDKRARPVKSYAELFAGDVMQFTIISHEKEAREFLHACSRSDYCHYALMRDTYNTDEWWLEIYRHDATKATAAQKLQEMLGADKIVAFGDNLNDLPVFAVSDECYAVANAVPEVKAAATGVIGSNEDCGVARWLEENGE